MTTAHPVRGLGGWRLRRCLPDRPAIFSSGLAEMIDCHRQRVAQRLAQR